VIVIVTFPIEPIDESVNSCVWTPSFNSNFILLGNDTGSGKVGVVIGLDLGHEIFNFGSEVALCLKSIVAVI
jgi:hypothetical protein